jgi:DNA (cytosine-5)-methyltransferase 1
MTKRLVDLFCGAGGAAMGYHRAGFEVVGVDIAPQPHYPFEFIQTDALSFVGYFWEERDQTARKFDAIHASPPCQAYTQMSAKHRGKGGKADSWPDLIGPTRELLQTTGLPYVIENVVGARKKMEPTLLLHGGMFNLGVHRPRLFECSFLVLSNPARMTLEPIGVYGNAPDSRALYYRKRNNGNMKGQSVIRCARRLEEASEAMGIDWMTWDEIKEAIPPAYTEYIGRQLMEVS